MSEEREIDRYEKEKWYKNIWYHYKIPICAAVVLLIAIGMFAYSSMTKEETDLYVLYVTENPEVYTEKVSALRSTLQKYAEDKTGDGYVVIFLDNIYIGDAHEANVVYKNKEKIATALRAGTCMIMLFDDCGRDYFTEGGFLCELSEELDIGVSGTYVKLNETPFMTQDTMVEWKNDLYIGLRVYEGTIAAIIPSSQENFDRSKKALENILTNNVINGATNE